ncbi:sugar ABC transporter permease [Vallitalea okinawensis]|uniref:sugar ABC transporter permease n=1 Tax=Vallitalea okinawensis TaxID=2078660 RepID=UPI000CFB8D94|nr:sugar ABC transporter permease [Vallitalea okinawensis]
MLKKRLKQLVIYTILIGIALIVLYPIAWTIGSSFNQGSSLQSTGINPIPDQFSLNQYRKLFTETDYLHWYKNTLKIAVINMIFSVAITSLSAYVFSRYGFKGKKISMISMLVLQIIPSFTGMVAMYIIIWKMGLLDTHLGLIIIYVAGQIPYNTWLVKGYLDTIPRELDAAAKVDGAGNFTTFFKIILPIARPIIVFLAIATFTAPWMDYIFPQLVLKSQKNWTLAIGLFEMIDGEADNAFSQFAAGCTLVAIPFTIFFMLSQKFMTEALGAGAVKS